MRARDAGLPVIELAPGLGELPFLPLAVRPTPLVSLAELAPEHPAAARVWFKRDDVVSPHYGGNKVRRWEWLFAQARARGKDSILSIGGTGSTQLTSLMIHGRRVGLTVSGIMFDQIETPFVAEAQELDQLAGGVLLHEGSYPRTAWRTVRELVSERRKRTLFIMPGASTPLANVSYVDAMLELGAQVQAGLAPRPDRIVVASGSGGTAVGLAIGVALLGWSTRVTAVRIADLPVSNRVTLGAAGRLTIRLLERHGLRASVGREALEIAHRSVGRGAGFPTPEAEAGALTYGRWFGAPGEITYSGKAIAGLLRLAEEHPTETILSWNTLSTTGRKPTE